MYQSTHERDEDRFNAIEKQLKQENKQTTRRKEDRQTNRQTETKEKNEHCLW